MNFDIADPNLADFGRQRIAWAATQMPVLATIRVEPLGTEVGAGRQNQSE